MFTLLDLLPRVLTLADIRLSIVDTTRLAPLVRQDFSKCASRLPALFDWLLSIVDWSDFSIFKAFRLLALLDFRPSTVNAARRAPPIVSTA